MTTEQTVQFVAGRLAGLSGTDRYRIDDALRLELKELSELLENTKE